MKSESLCDIVWAQSELSLGHGYLHFLWSLRQLNQAVIVDFEGEFLLSTQLSPYCSDETLLLL